MKYCSQCGTPIPDGTKFCRECGQKVAPDPVQPVYEPPVQQSYEPPQQTYEPPVQQSYEAPQQTYEPPMQQSYEPPQQTYEPPVQQSYEPPQQTYAPPAQPSYEPSTQSGGGSYVPPAAPKAPKAPKEKKPINKKIFLFAGIAVIAVVLIVILVSCLGGKGKDDPNLGRYEGVSCMAEGMELGADGAWMELKAKGKADVCVLDTEFSGTWKLDGQTFTFKQGGDQFEGTLKDGVLIIDFGGLVYTFEKAGGTKAEKPVKTAAEVGYWTLLRVDGAANAMSEEDVAMFKDLGIEMFADLKEDGTGVLVLDNPANITWAGGIITAEDGTTLTYKLEKDLLKIEMGTEVYVMTRGEGSAPEVKQNATLGGGTDPDEGRGDLLSGYEWWDGTWYGWYVISNANSAYEGNINNAYDVTATITVYGDDTGYVEIVDIDGEDVCECSVSFGPGITENGCMMSEEGSIFGFDIGHADWIVDPGASMVSDFDYMIQIDGTIVDEDDDWFDYKLFLRPWGMDWEDIRYADTSNMLYDDMLPLYYDDWYVPQLEGGAPVSTGNSDGYSGFDGPTDLYDYAGAGEIFFEYPMGSYVFDNSFGIEALENTDGSVRITFSAIQDDFSIEGMRGYVDGCSVYEKYKKEEVTIGGYPAQKATYLDEWGDAAESVYIEFGSGEGKYLAILINVSAYSEALRDSAEVQSIINSMQVK